MRRQVTAVAVAAVRRAILRIYISMRTVVVGEEAAGETPPYGRKTEMKSGGRHVGQNRLPLANGKQ